MSLWDLWVSGNQSSFGVGLSYSGPAGSPYSSCGYFSSYRWIIGIEILSSWQKSHIVSLTCTARVVSVGKVHLKLLGLFLPRKMVNEKQYCITWGIAEVSSTLKDWKNAWVVISTTPAFNSFWFMQRTSQSWRMTIDYHKLNWVVTTIASLIPGMVLLLEQLTHPLVPGSQLLIWEMFFSSIPANEDHQKPFAFSGKASNTSSLFYLRGTLML